MPHFDGSGQRVQDFALSFSEPQKDIFPQTPTRELF